MKIFVVRMFLLVAEAVLASVALWGGSGMHTWAMLAFKANIKTGSPITASWPITLLILLGIGAIVVGGHILIESAKGFKKGYPFDDTEAIIYSMICFVSASFVFGAIVAPLDNGFSIEAWVTPWVLLLIVGFLPTAYTVKDLVLEGIRTRKITARRSRTPLRVCR